MTPIKAILLDFMGVCATARMATSFDDTGLNYVLNVDEEVIRLVQHHRAEGVLVGLVTNNDRAQFTTAHPGVKLDEWFDAVIFSSDVGVSKPNTKIYMSATERLGVQPDECIYVDDLAGNVDAAVGLGMQGAIAPSPSATAELLRLWLRNA